MIHSHILAVYDRDGRVRDPKTQIGLQTGKSKTCRASEWQSHWTSSAHTWLDFTPLPFPAAPLHNARTRLETARTRRRGSNSSSSAHIFRRERGRWLLRSDQHRTLNSVR